jgi:hypothetical protein
VQQNKALYTVIALIVIGSTGAYALRSQEQTDLILPGTVIDARPTHYTEVDNIVQNMIDGSVTQANAHDYIFTEIYFAKKTGETLSGSELKENQKYVAYLKEKDNFVKNYYPEK